MKKTNIFKRIATTFATVIIAISANTFSVNTTASENESDYTAMADRVISLVNEAREEAGLEPVYAVPYLNEVAEERAEKCVANPAQTKIGGNHFVTLINYDIAPWSDVAETTATGIATPEETFNYWKSSPTQWATIMNPEFTHMGVGVAYDPDSTCKWYWQQILIEVDTFEVPDGNLDGQYIPATDEVAVQSEENAQITGDIDNDGVIDSFDYVLLCRYLTNQITLDSAQLESADILQDGVVDYSDADCLRKYILGQIEEVPVKL
ncbi:MAG: hypothetical protein K2L10_02905 [Ruminococcus sp.]|nr:hypothetical protein [Ruminococcus sp.]